MNIFNVTYEIEPWMTAGRYVWGQILHHSQLVVDLYRWGKVASGLEAHTSGQKLPTWGQTTNFYNVKWAPCLWNCLARVPPWLPSTELFAFSTKKDFIPIVFFLAAVGLA